MLTVILMGLGMIAFVVGTVALGIWLRRHPTKEMAEQTSRITHFLYFAGMVAPGVVAIFSPGLDRLDELFGISPLPFQPAAFVVGAVLLLIGLYFSFVSTRALRSLGSGANAFILTKRVVVGDMYTRTRNPMSLGYYLICVGIGLAVGSTFVTLGSLLVLIPVHVFYLKFFEETELELRLGQPYVEYKRTAPFLIPDLARRPRAG